MRRRYVPRRKPRPACAGDIHRRLLDQSRAAEGLGAAFQWNLTARAASKRSNCKGSPGLPCAVTPRMDVAVKGPSDHRNILRNAQANVCPPVNNPRARSRTNTPGAGTVGRLKDERWNDGTG
jgi:hypothetical protein